MAGKLIVIEGTDAAGKSTQAKMLSENLSKIGKKTEIINFPTYESAFGQLISKYLAGEFGKKESIPPEAISTLYALDRYQYVDSLKSKLKEGKIIICNRYSQSNLYQAAKIPIGKRRDAFIKWVDQLESRLPAADAVIFLNIDVNISKKLLANRGRQIDIHEKDLKYQENVRKLYLREGKKRGWIIIDCTKDGELLGKEHISAKIFASITNLI